MTPLEVLEELDMEHQVCFIEDYNTAYAEPNLDKEGLEYLIRLVEKDING